LRQLAESSDLVIAADGGAEAAGSAGIVPHLLVGDMDSVTSEARTRLVAAGTESHIVPAAKDFSDTELALQLAVERGASDIGLAAGWGGRMDHAVANLCLLLRAKRQGVRMCLLDGDTEASLVGGRTSLAASRGDLVSLIPLSQVVEGITTHGLRYPLAGDSLIQGSTRGLSNEVISLPAEVEQAGSGDLLLIHTRTHSV
jgi:thiamine pyrophosphokinase